MLWICLNIHILCSLLLLITHLHTHVCLLQCKYLIHLQRNKFKLYSALDCGLSARVFTLSLTLSLFLCTCMLYYLCALSSVAAVLNLLCAYVWCSQPLALLPNSNSSVCGSFSPRKYIEECGRVAVGFEIDNLSVFCALTNG